MSLKGKVVVITGGASGIGLCAAKRFLHQGANVVIVDLNTSKAESDPELLPFIEAGAVVFQLANVTKEEDVAAYNAKALERYGRVDITVLSAGICHEVSEWIHLPLKTVQKSFDVNVRGVWLGIKHGAKAMLRDLSPNADRNFVLLSSVAGLGGRPKLAAYSASKWAVRGLGETAAAEFAPHLRCNLVLPGGIDSDMFYTTFTPAQAKDIQTRIPLGRLGRIDEIADVILFLASQKAAQINGATLAVHAGVMPIST